MNSSALSIVLVGCKQPERPLRPDDVRAICRGSKSTVRSAIPTAQCPLVVAAPTDYWTQIHESVFFQFYIVKCPGISLKLNVNLVMVNPNDQYLSSQFLPLAELYRYLAFVWLPVLLVQAWLYNAGVTSTMQRLICVVPLMKLISLGSISLYFQEANSTGSYSRYAPILCPFLPIASP